jgi:hypothetical protein
MASLLDHPHCANLMRQQHGGAAAIEGIVLGTACLERGDHQGHHVWLEIVRSLHLLESQSERGATTDQLSRPPRQ